MIVLLAVLASALTVSAQHGKHDKGSQKLGAIVTGHWEGPPGGHGEVCVNTVCQSFTHNSGNLSFVLSPGQVASSTVTVRIADSVGPLVVAEDQFDGGFCKNMPVLGSDFFTPCAHPDYLAGPVKRFNLIINSAAGGPNSKGGTDNPR